MISLSYYVFSDNEIYKVYSIIYKPLEMLINIYVGSYYINTTQLPMMLCHIIKYNHFILTGLLRIVRV